MRSPPSWLPAPVSLSVAAHVAALALAPLPRSHAQAPTGAARAAPDSTVEVVAGPQYAAGWLTRLLFGTDYRAAWTAPIRVPVLDLRRVGGGLTPTSVGGGMQTKSMWFRGGDGYEYGFRSVDKDASNLPPGLQGTLLERLALDQNSAQHPAAPIVAARLTEGDGKLQHLFEVVKPGTKKNPWQIDGITGATISSKAVGKLLNASAPRHLPPVQKNMSRLKEGK